MAKGTFNKVILVGRLGNDPEVRYLPSGSAVANISVATDDGYKKDGEERPETNWHRCTAFGKLAEIIKDYCFKGQKILAEGRIKYEEWEGQDGKKVYGTKIILNSLQMLSRRDDDNSVNKNDAPPTDQQDEDSVPF
jgi:single-strand DNA-binding protein